MKNKTISIIVLGAIMVASSAIGLVACKKKIDPPPDGNDHQYVVDGSLLTINKAGLVIYEAEEVDTAHYVISSDNASKVVERSDASGGKFLAAAAEGIESAGGNYFAFTLDLQFNAQITISAFYSQTENNKGNDIDMSKSYTYLIDEAQTLRLSGNSILFSRNDITNWQEITYNSFTLSKGTHTVRGFVSENTGKGNPNIDYFKFNAQEISEDQVVGITVPENDFHTPLQYAYIQDSYQNIFNYTKGVFEFSKPNAITLDFSYLDDSPTYFVEYADNAEFERPTTVYDITSNQYGVYNLKLGQELYWKAATSLTELQSAQINHITVASVGPRNLYIDGISNIRDIGGYNSSLVSGATITQGLYLRGANPDGLTEAGKAELLKLGIKTEIDLRDEDNGKGIDGLNYHSVPIPYGTQSTEFSKLETQYLQIFTLIANADISPVYLHSDLGSDRAGLCSFILLTVCGASYEDIARDYLFSNFSAGGVRELENEFVTWWNKLENYAGTSMADKAKSWLISKGITSQQVERIREIFVEGYTANNDPSVQQPTTSTLSIDDFKSFKFEAEDANLNDWLIADIHKTQIVTKGDVDKNGKQVAAANTASGEKFVAAASGGEAECNSGLYLEFKVILTLSAKITLVAHYVQSQDKLDKTPDLAKNFTVTLGDKTLSISGNTVMSAITDGNGSSWTSFTYNTVAFEAGEYTFKLQVNYDFTEQGNPNIDYFEFVAVDPATPGPEIPQPPVDTQPIVTMDEYGNYKFEAEYAVTDNYFKSDEYETTVVERRDASGGKFLAAASADKVGKDENYLTFTILVAKDGNFTLSMSIVQTESQKGNVQVISDIFGAQIEGPNIGEQELVLMFKTVLTERADATAWELFTYNTVYLKAGTYEVKLYVKENTGRGVPNIDYFGLTLEER